MATQAWSSGSSGRSPSARIHRRWTGSWPVAGLPRQVADVAAGRWGGAGRTTRPARRDRAASRSGRLGRSSGAGTSGIANWCSRPGLVVVEGGRHVEDGPAVLDGHHPPGGERPPVADAVHLVEDGDGGVPRPQEVGVQRVDPALFDGAAGGHQGLGRPPGRRRPAGAPPRAACPGRCSPRWARDPAGAPGSRGTRSPAHVGRPSPQLRTDRPAPVPSGLVERHRPGPAGASPTGSCGGRPRRPTRSRAATSTTTGGTSSTTRPRDAPSPAGTPVTRSTAGPRTWTWWPSSGSGPTGSRSSGAASSRPRASGRRPPWTTTAASAPGAGSGGSRPVVTFHHFTSPRAGWPAGAAGRPPTSPSASPASWSRTVGHLGDVVGRGLHPERAQRHGAPGLPTGARSRPGSRDASTGHDAVNGPWSGPTGWPSRRCGPVRATSRSGSPCPWPRWWPCPAARRWPASAPRRSSRTLPGGHRGRRLRGRAVYTRMRFGPEGLAPPEPGVPVTQMGYEFWPEAARAHRAPGRGGHRPPGAGHRERDRHRRRRPADRLSPPRPCRGGPAAWPTGSTCAGYFAWSLLDNFEWTSATARSSACSRWTATTFERRPKPSAAWFGAAWPGQRPAAPVGARPEPDEGPRGGSDTRPGDRRRVARMVALAKRIWAWLHTHEGIKIFRYTMVSVISTAVSFVVLVHRLRGAAHCGPRCRAPSSPTAVATFPSYWLNRQLGVGEVRPVAPDEGGRAVLGHGRRGHRLLHRRGLGGPPHRHRARPEPRRADRRWCWWPTSWPSASSGCSSSCSSTGSSTWTTLSRRSSEHLDEEEAERPGDRQGRPLGGLEAAGRAPAASVPEVLELQGDAEVLVLAGGDDRLEVVALLAGHPELVALGLGATRPSGRGP